jgi:hypothetical protein
MIRLILSSIAWAVKFYDHYRWSAYFYWLFYGKLNFMLRIFMFSNLTAFWDLNLLTFRIENQNGGIIHFEKFLLIFSSILCVFSKFWFKSWSMWWQKSNEQYLTKLKSIFNIIVWETIITLIPKPNSLSNQTRSFIHLNIMNYLIDGRIV